MSKCHILSGLVNGIILFIFSIFENIDIAYLYLTM